MSEQHAEFRNRLRRLDRKHAKAVHGYTARMRADGLIVVEPRKAVRARFPGRAIFLFAVSILAFKALLMASLGYESYNFRVAALASGSVLEQAGAWIMTSDPLSIKIAEQLMPYLR